MKYLLVLLSLLVVSLEMMAQDKKGEIVTRVAQIEVYPQYLKEYLQTAHDVAETSMRNEKGVLFLYPMQVEREKNKIVILEYYCD